MYCRFIVLTFAFFPCFSTASSFCEAPKFEELVRAGTSVTPDPGGLAITMQPIAEVRIPSDFSKIGSLPNGSIGFGGHPKGISAVLGYETSESLSVNKKGGQPASFFLSVFKAKDAIGCQYLHGYQLELQDYRLHAVFSGTGELFAFGKEDRHQFYLIRIDKPDVVLSGMFRNIDRIEFESILSTIVIK